MTSQGVRFDIGSLAALCDGFLVDAVEFGAQVFGNVVDDRQQVSHSCAQHIDQGRERPVLAVGLFVGQFAPAVLQQGADLEFADHGSFADHDPEVDVPRSIAGVLRRRQVVPL